MASEKQIKLSDFIKQVHKKLRDDTKILGHENAWKNHCKDFENLNKYAKAMEELATKYWEENQQKEDSKALSRISWVFENCCAYYKNGGLLYQRKREVDIALKNNLEDIKLIEDDKERKLKLLDVGSCYNPFKKYELFDVLPIDLAPANKDVYQCDFLNLKLIDVPHEIDLKSNILNLEKLYFDIVVFSLLLEYMPSPEQRLLCCENAYNLLKPEGILLIITPDAKHVNANTKYMKSWRYVLAKLGFCRIKYEKLTFIHCMVFRKSINPEVAKRWAVLNENKKLFDKIYIPQDFNNKESL